MKNKDFKNMILLVTYGILLFVFIMKYEWIVKILKFIWNLLLPFVIGCIIAFVLNIIVNSLEEKLLSKMKRGKRVLSTIMSLCLVFGFLIIFLFILIPQLQRAGSIFIQNIPKYQENIYSIGQKIGLDKNELKYFDLENNSNIKNEIINFISKNRSSFLNMSMGFANSIFNAICDFFVGLIFAIYILLDKENLSRQLKKLLKRISSEKFYNKVLKVAKLSNTTFNNFVKVQVFEAFVLGFLCFIGMIIIGLPYSASISVVVGITALIPIFGAFIGCAIGAFLIFMISPLQSLIFIIFFIILQQIETNFIYPRVVGGKIGLPSIWVLVAVTIGGSIGGVFGMLVGVPLVSVCYTLIKQFVNKKA